MSVDFRNLEPTEWRRDVKATSVAIFTPGVEALEKYGLKVRRLDDDFDTQFIAVAGLPDGTQIAFDRYEKSPQPGLIVRAIPGRGAPAVDFGRLYGIFHSHEGELDKLG